MANIIKPYNVTDVLRTDSGVMIYTDSPPLMRVFFALVGVLSIFCNGALCIMVIRKRSMRMSSYNVLVLILAAIDTITGFFVLASPSYVLGNEIMPIPSGLFGRIFCILLQRNFFVWLLANFSVCVVTCMAVERWYALVYPHKYRLIFMTRKTLFYLTMPFGTVLIIMAPTFISTDVTYKDSKMVCYTIIILRKGLVDQLYVVFYCTVTAFLPFLVTVISCLHMKHSTSRTQNPVTQAQRSRRQLEVSLSKMSVAITFVLALLIFPSKIAFTLYHFKLTEWQVVHYCATLAVLNSAVNPWIYCLTNKVYRREFRQFFCTWYKNVNFVRNVPESTYEINLHQLFPRH